MEASNDERHGDATERKDNGFNLYPVSETDSGKGLPYAPEDWPRPGDTWAWRAGKRIAASGYFYDRYLYLPSRLERTQGKHKKRGFASKLSVEQYIRETFPGADVNAFFASFSWKIPSEQLSERKVAHFGVMAKHLGSESESGTVGCKAGNKMCSSLVEAKPISGAMLCDICCIEPGFCRDCCCILCSKIVDLAFGGYNFIRCQAPVAEDFICGHIAHLECGLRAYMAGTVGGNIDLDAEYYCRRCDNKTDLALHVSKLLQACESVFSHNEVEKILNVAIRLLHGSRKTSTQRLLHHIELVTEKLKSRICLGDIWKMECTPDVTRGLVSQHGNDESEGAKSGETPDTSPGSLPIFSGNFNPVIESLKLEQEVDDILLALRKSQELEYKMVQENLYAQMNYIQNLYEQLDMEKSELSRHTSGIDPDGSFELVLNRVNQIEREVIKLGEMKEVAKGFGKTSKDILKEHFDFEM